jgi:DNA-binding CsgD family transcriptional regulator
MARTPEVEPLGVVTGEERSLGPGCCCDLPHLTEAQIRVLLQVADRKSSKQAAAALGNSPHTVDSHVKDLLQATGASDRGELVRMAIEHGVIDMSTGTARQTGKRCVQPKPPAV